LAKGGGGHLRRGELGCYPANCNLPRLATSANALDAPLATSHRVISPAELGGPLAGAWPLPYANRVLRAVIRHRAITVVIRASLARSWQLEDNLLDAFPQHTASELGQLAPADLDGQEVVA
jgi:hypothetical protein